MVSPTNLYSSSRIYFHYITIILFNLYPFQQMCRKMLRVPITLQNLIIFGWQFKLQYLLSCWISYIFISNPIIISNNQLFNLTYYVLEFLIYLKFYSSDPLLLYHSLTTRQCSLVMFKSLLKAPTIYLFFFILYKIPLHYVHNLHYIYLSTALSNHKSSMWLSY